MSADTGLTLTVCSAETEPDSPSADGLSLLASWAATQALPTPSPVATRTSAQEGDDGHA